MFIFESDVKAGKYQGLWACKLASNKSADFVAPVQSVVTNVTLDVEVDHQRGRTTLGLYVEEYSAKQNKNNSRRNLDVNEFVAVCSLLPGRVKNFLCQIPLSAGKKYTFKALGLNLLNVVGYFDTDPNGEPGKQNQEQAAVLRGGSSGQRPKRIREAGAEDLRNPRNRDISSKGPEQSNLEPKVKRPRLEKAEKKPSNSVESSTPRKKHTQALGPGFKIL